jgi:dephospho-CoA kinase
MPQDEKKRYADYLIDTSEGFESARQETDRVYRALRAEAAKRHGDEK